MRWLMRRGCEGRVPDKRDTDWPVWFVRGEVKGVMAQTALERLRAATRESHETLETRLDVLGRMATLDGRKVLAERFHALHAGMEAALAPHLKEIPDLDFAARRRTPLLEADMQALGVSAADPIQVKAVGSRAEALGFFYVLEGSSLGGRVIGKQAAARGLDMMGMSFLNPYGARTGEYWKGFLAVLDRECPAGDPAAGEAAARAAVLGFAHAEAALCAEATS